MIRLIVVVILGASISCSTTAPTTQEIIDGAISTSGTSVLKNASATFTFRGISYTYEKQAGRFKYSRIQKDTLGNEVNDVLTNDGLVRYINNLKTIIGEKKKAAYTSSVNSVIYFAFLPFSLNDAAVNKTLVGKAEIKNNDYYKVKVTFDAEGGGEDFEDVFYYWFDTKDYSMDYLAYSYNEDDGKGVRFREAYNTRKINGVTIQDYRNYKPLEEDGFDLAYIDQAYVNGELELLSVIELEDVTINRNN